MIFFSPNHLLSWLQIESSAAIYWWVAALLLFKLWIIALLSSYVMLKKAQRSWARRRNQLREAEYRAFIRDYIRHTNSKEQREQLEIALRRRQGSRMERGFLRRIMLDEMEHTQDEGERLVINGLYAKLGFLEADLKELKSKFWWQRLASVIRLEQLKNPSLEAALSDAIEDPNDLVAISAMRAFGGLGKADGLRLIMDEISRRVPARRDLYIEILRQFGRDRASQIIDYIEDCYDPFIAAIGLEVLGDLKAPEAIPICLQLSRSSADEVAIAAIQALGKFKAPQAVPEFKTLLESESAFVRAHALIALTSFEREDFRSEVDKLKKDSSVEVQRAIHSALQEEEPK